MCNKPVIRGYMDMRGSEAAGFTARDCYALSRMLISAGYNGKLLLFDKVTGKLRFTIADIDKASKLAIRENDARGPHLVKYVEADFSKLSWRKQVEFNTEDEEI